MSSQPDPKALGLKSSSGKGCSFDVFDAVIMIIVVLGTVLGVGSVILLRRDYKRRLNIVSASALIRRIRVLNDGGLGQPMTTKVLSDNPRVTLIRNFLTPEMCDDLIQLAGERLKRSTVVSSGGDSDLDPSRTSYSASLEKSETPTVHDVEEAASLLSHFPVSHLEPLQVVRYNPGQEYKMHYDYFIPGSAGADEAIRASGQRLMTLFVYLNDLHEDDTGGGTSFPQLGLTVKPKKGSAVVFWNVHPNGRVDDRMEHAGLPPTKSTKYGLNIWIRERPWE